MMSQIGVINVYIVLTLANEVHIKIEISVAAALMCLESCPCRGKLKAAETLVNRNYDVPSL